MSYNKFPRNAMHAFLICKLRLWEQQLTSNQEDASHLALGVFRGF